MGEPLDFSLPLASVPPGPAFLVAMKQPGLGQGPGGRAPQANDSSDASMPWGSGTVTQWEGRGNPDACSLEEVKGPVCS